MKLRLSQQQQDQSRPTSLSLDFFSSLMANQSKRQGMFQILSFNRKRERVYSTKLNDGYFILKVMMVNEAADQLQNGLIKPLYILQGNVRNHGQGVIVIKEEMKYWQYLKEVGQPVIWKHKKENVNYKGSNFVVWSTQKIQNLHKSQSREIQNCPFQLSSGKKQNQKVSKVQKEKQSQQLQKIQADQTIVAVKQTQVKHCDEYINQCQTQPIFQQQKIKTPRRENNEQRFQSILQCLLTDGSSEDQFQINQQLPSQQRLSTNRKKLLERKTDLQFIFNCLSDEGEQLQQNKNLIASEVMANSVEKDNESDNDYDLIEWINRKKQSNELNKQVGLNKQNVKQSKSKHKVVNKIQVSFEDLYHGFISNNTIWQVNALVKCISKQSEIAYAVLCDQNHRFPIHATFINTHLCQQQLKQNQMFIIGKGVIKHSVLQRVNCSSFDIQFDCANCILQPIQYEQQNQMEQPSQNYSRIDKIYEMQEGLIINCYGILKDFKTFKGKSTNIQHYQIVDPLSKWSIVFIQFQSINPQEVKVCISKPISIYGAAISSYKSKKNIARKAFTIIKYDWFPLTKQSKLTRQWMQSNSICNIDIQLVGYTQLCNLSTIQDQPVTNLYLNKVVILEFKSKISYRACSKCFKKVEDNRCRNCGIRKPSEIQNRLFLRGEIADQSATVNVIWSNSLAQSILSEGFIELKKKWLLKNVSVWIDKGSNGNLSIVRMKQSSINLLGAIQQIKRNIL